MQNKISSMIGFHC